MQPPATVSLEDAEFRRLNFRSLAETIAFGMFKPSEAMRRFGLNPSQGHLLATNGKFKEMMAEAKQLWATMTPAERARHKAQVAVDEILLDEMVLLAMNEKNAAGDRMDANKAIMKVAGFDNTRGAGNDRDAGPSATPFSIQIHLGNDKITTITAAPTIEGRPA